MRLTRQELMSLVRCPACRGRLAAANDTLECSACTLFFREARGTPILLLEDRSLFGAAEVAAATGTKTEVKGLRRFLPSISTNLAADQNYEHLSRLLTERAEPLVLSVGGGEGGRGITALAAQNKILTTDVALGTNTDAVADGHDLPFADGTFDAVVLQAVLEHVLDPARTVSEAERVLKPGGFVYAETPFMQQVHMGAYDFTRFTPLGHRWLFRNFEQVDAGVAVGPGSSAAWALTYLAASFARNPAQRRVLQAVGRFAFFWLRWLDKPVAHNDAAWDAASGVYFLGRKTSDAPLDGRRLIANYRGSIL